MSKRIVFPFVFLALCYAHTAAAGSIVFVLPGGTSTVSPAIDNLIFADGDLGNPMYGFSIDVSAIFGDNTPLNSGSAPACLGCELEFETGGLVDSQPAAPADPSIWEFGGGGTISVTGHVDFNNDGIVDPDEPNGLLLGGFFTGNPLSIDLTADPTITGLVLASVIDAKHPFLNNYFGVGDKFRDGTLLLDFDGVRFGRGFSSTAINASFIINPIPEPTTLLLLGLGLVGFAGTRRRRHID